MLGITVQAQTAVQHVPQWNALQSTIAHALSPNPNGHQEDSFGASTYSITPMSSPCIWSTSRADEQWSLGFCPGLPKSRIGQSTCLPEKGGAVLVHQGCYRLMLVVSIWSSTKPQNPSIRLRLLATDGLLTLRSCEYWSCYASQGSLIAFYLSIGYFIVNRVNYVIKTGSKNLSYWPSFKLVPIPKKN